MHLAVHIDPVAVPLALHIGAFLDAPVRQAPDPVAVPLALHIGAFPYVPVRVAKNPVAVHLAVHIGAFLDAPVRKAPDPVAVHLALHIGAFPYVPVRVAKNPVALLLAVLEGSCTFRSLLAPIPDPLERSRPLRPLPGTLAGPCRGPARLQVRIPNIALRLVGQLHPAGRAFRFPRAMILDAGLGAWLLPLYWRGRFRDGFPRLLRSGLEGEMNVPFLEERFLTAKHQQVHCFLYHLIQPHPIGHCNHRIPTRPFILDCRQVPIIFPIRAGRPFRHDKELRSQIRK